jgi:hypothetical protein
MASLFENKFYKNRNCEKSKIDVEDLKVPVESPDKDESSHAENPGLRV